MGLLDSLGLTRVGPDSYETEDAVTMIEVAPHQYVNVVAARNTRGGWKKEAKVESSAPRFVYPNAHLPFGLPV